MNRYVLAFAEVQPMHAAAVGAKGLHLAELSRVEGVRVPAGFCVTTDAFRRVIADAQVGDSIDRLSRLVPGDRDAIGALSATIRKRVEAVPIPDDLAASIGDALDRLGEHAACAVRSSATAEDSPTASFAGQQDTYLNVVGPAAILRHVSRCWASLFTERAVTYRLRTGIGHRTLRMAVVVQRMIFAEAAGVLFTADPVTGNRTIATVEAAFGLGETLVSGRVNPDVYQVRDGDIVAKTIGTKHVATDAIPGGGTRERAIGPERQRQPALTDAQVVRLAGLGRRIEAHFGRPQDIEWCLVNDDFHIVQSRPITTLFPIPDAGDRENHVYVSVGHQQMMTDAMKPLGLAFWQMTTPRPMAEAGGRLFVDVTRQLASEASRPVLLATLGKSDPLIADALQRVVERGFIPPRPDEGPAWTPPGAGASSIETDPAIVTELIARTEAFIAALKRDIRAKSGPELFEFIRSHVQAVRGVQFDPRSLQVIMAGMEAAWWLNDHLQRWLGETNAADTIVQSVSDNITSAMGLALLDVADVIRPHRGVVAFLQRVADDRREDGSFLEELARLPGGTDARDAIRDWLGRYGMRCPGEIDITRPRWSELPGTLVPIVLGHVRNFEPRDRQARFERRQQAVREKEQELLARLRPLPDGDRKADETREMIARVRIFSGYREYPKYAMVSRYFVYKQALLEEAERLVRAQVLREKEDIYYLRFDELHDVVRMQQADDELIRRRKDEFRSYESLTPPRVLTSDGEAVAGSYGRTDRPEGALEGLPVSGGIVEGRARVVVSMADADLQSGDILVTTYTDPSWTPLFVTIAGLVTEVGGLMTHGAVIAREYGLPAVVGVHHATRRIRDGQRIRVDGTAGHVEILPAAPPRLHSS